MTDHESTKTCTKCHCELPLSSFNRQKGALDGRRPDCRDCRRVQHKAYYEKNRDKLAEYRQNTRERRREVYRRWAEEHRAERQEYNKRWREENPGYGREWREANPGKLRAYWLKHGAARRGMEGEVSEELVTQMVVDQGGLCAYCEVSLEGNFEVDHMLPVSRGGGHDWTNLAITCRPCNRSKSTKTVEEFMEIRGD